jgi:hypothetical protein
MSKRVWASQIYEKYDICIIFAGLNHSGLVMSDRSIFYLKF